MTDPARPALLRLRGISLNPRGQPGPRPGGHSRVRRGGPADQAAGPGRAGDRPAGHRRLPPARPVLGPIDLTVGAGELVLVQGPSGSGKTALLHVIALLERPDAGSYLLDDLAVTGLGDRDLAALRARRIGSVLQRPCLLPGRSALDNVMLALLYSGVGVRQRRRRALDALDLVGLADQAATLAGGLAAGQRRRVAIAAALAPAPDLLVCDNPTADLDPALTAQVIGLLAGLHRDGRTVLIATDDQIAAAYATQRLVLGLAGARGSGAGGSGPGEPP
ncbi:MAG: ATP-binding cassette domain-containing protein [Streptosporangiaceae bacterium]